jgi:hypothetical protein
MANIKYLKAECQHCGVHIEFPVDQIGLVVPCPACSKETELLLPTPPDEPAIPRRVLVFTSIAVLILVFGLIATLIGLKRAEKWATRRAKPATTEPAPTTATNEALEQPTNAQPDAVQNGFEVSPVELQKTAGSSLIYAVGRVKNTLDKQRFGVRVELGLFNADGQKLGTSRDYRQVLEPGAQWEFKALVMDSKAASAKVEEIKEEQ